MIRFGADAGRDRARGIAPASTAVRDRGRRLTRAKPRRAAERRAPGVGGARSGRSSTTPRLHARPASRSSRARPPAPRIPRPRRSAACCRRARTLPAEYCGCGRAAQRGAPPRSRRDSLARRARCRGRERSSTLGAELVERGAEAIVDAARAAFTRSAAGELGLDVGDARLRRRAADRRRRSTPGSTRDLERGATGARTAPARPAHRRRRPRPARVRVTGRAADRRALARHARGGGAAQRQRDVAARCSSTTCSSELDGDRRRALAERSSPARARPSSRRPLPRRFRASPRKLSP